MLVNILDKSNFQITIDGSLYSAEVIHKCFYWYGNKFSVDIGSEKNFFLVTLSSLAPIEDVDEVIHKIKTDLIDFKTREIISNDTKNIRELLIAKAFAHHDEFDELPTGNISDPAGFDPSTI